MISDNEVRQELARARLLMKRGDHNAAREVVERIAVECPRCDDALALRDTIEREAVRLAGLNEREIDVTEDLSSGALLAICLAGTIFVAGGLWMFVETIREGMQAGFTTQIAGFHNGRPLGHFPVHLALLPGLAFLATGIACWVKVYKAVRG